MGTIIDSPFPYPLFPPSPLLSPPPPLLPPPIPPSPPLLPPPNTPHSPPPVPLSSPPYSSNREVAAPGRSLSTLLNCATTASAQLLFPLPPFPPLTAATGRSLSTLLNCATTASAPTACADCTPRVFCAVTAVIAVAHHAPCAALDLISAWTPAPPPESDPAIVNTTGTGADAEPGAGPAAGVSGAAQRARVGRGYLRNAARVLTALEVSGTAERNR
ncbi:unnamed protein product [Closterium sp. NIES-65]|nr:unnamed protein product [Closterium sp. NIES-65]